MSYGPLRLVHRAATDSSTMKITFGGRSGFALALTAADTRRGAGRANAGLTPSGSKSVRSASRNGSVIRTMPWPRAASSQDETRTQWGFSAIRRSCRLTHSFAYVYWPTKTHATVAVAATACGRRLCQRDERPRALSFKVA